MRPIPSLLCAMLPALAAAPLGAQDLPELVARLMAGDNRPRVLQELRRLGPTATAAVAAALPAADAAAAPVLARALAELPGCAEAVPHLLAQIPRASISNRDPLLHALGNCLPRVGDDALDPIAEAVAGWASAGLFYSPGPEQPTFAWYEFVRLRRRLTICRGGCDHEALAGQLAAIARQRRDLGGLGIATPEDQLCNLGRFGQHGTREHLEAIAELAAAAGPQARDLAAGLYEYLQHEAPRAAEILTEHCAGIGENAPDNAPAVQYPTLWRRDDWRFACARAVFASDADPAHRQHALRHLLHSPSPAERIDAILAVRAAAPPWLPFAADLTARLDDPERTVAREALITLGLADQATRAAVPTEPLQRLAHGPDRELAALARRLLAGK